MKCHGYQTGMAWKGVFKTRHFRIWSVCLLIVLLSAFIMFVGRLASRSSEPWVSVNFTVTTNYLDGEAVTYNESMITMQVSNSMSFDVAYLILADVRGLGSKTYANVQVGQRYSI